MADAIDGINTDYAAPAPPPPQHHEPPAQQAPQQSPHQEVHASISLRDTAHLSKEAVGSHHGAQHSHSHGSHHTSHAGSQHSAHHRPHHGAHHTPHHSALHAAHPTSHRSQPHDAHSSSTHSRPPSHHEPAPVGSDAHQEPFSTPLANRLADYAKDVKDGGAAKGTASKEAPQPAEHVQATSEAAKGSTSHDGSGLQATERTTPASRLGPAGDRPWVKDQTWKDVKVADPAPSPSESQPADDASRPWLKNVSWKEEKAAEKVGETQAAATAASVVKPVAEVGAAGAANAASSPARLVGEVASVGGSPEAPKVAAASGPEPAKASAEAAKADAEPSSTVPMRNGIPDYGKYPTPKQLSEQLEAAAKKHGIPPNILKAQAYKESTYGKHLIEQGNSRTGRGVMQIDVQWHPFARTKEAMNAAANIDYGAKFLKSLKDRFGDWDQALKHYNGSWKYQRAIRSLMQSEPWKKLGG